MTDNLLYSSLVDGQRILKINNKFTFQYASTLKHYLTKYTEDKNVLIIDLSDCSYMDSTILGLIAGYSIKYHKSHNAKLKVYNLGDYINNLFKVLGILKLVDIENNLDYNKDNLVALRNIPFKNGKNLVYETHKTLSEIDSDNKERFKNVLEQLEDK